MPHNTATAASATGTPAPIEGAGAPSGMACAAVAASMRHPLANIASNLIYRSPWVIDRWVQPIIMYQFRQVVCSRLT